MAASAAPIVQTEPEDTPGSTALHTLGFFMCLVGGIGAGFFTLLAGVLALEGGSGGVSGGDMFDPLGWAAVGAVLFLCGLWLQSLGRTDAGAPRPDFWNAR